MIRKKLATDFTKFLLVGIIWTILSIVLAWLLIDILGLYGWLGSSITTAIVFIGRYYNYLSIDLIEKNFIKYASANISFSLGIILFMTLFVDILSLSAKISSPIVIGGLFIIKFFTFKKINLIRK